MIIAVGLLQACKQHTGYTINGELADANGMRVMLKKIIANSNDRVRLDSCVVKKGKFKMKGTLEYPEYCELYVGDNGPLQLIVENTVIDIAVDLKNIQNSRVTGSKETDLLVEYNDKVARMDTMPPQRIEYMKQFVSEHLNSIAAALVVNNHLAYYLEPEELETCAYGFDAAIGKSPWALSIREKADAAKRLAIGQPFVDLKLPAPDGNEIALSDYAGKDKYVLIIFWASWNKLCRMANPHLVELYNKYKDNELEIVGLSLDKDKTEWIQAIEADALPWPQMSDLKFWKSEGVRLYSVISIPYIILLDKEGKILTKELQPDESGKFVELEKKLAELTKLAE